MLVTAAPAVTALPTEAPMMMMGPITANTTAAVEKRADILSYLFWCAVSPFLSASEACSYVVINMNNAWVAK